MAKQVNAYVALANGELKTKEQIKAAKKARADIHLKWDQGVGPKGIRNENSIGG
ncbi:hypothetical protein RCO48_17545 [Peribacillus frigoritolerans]|nr:hypothetical protein [Peribacillus frigoritolerans]